jgi:hypothetical protein
MLRMELQDNGMVMIEKDGHREVRRERRYKVRASPGTETMVEAVLDDVEDEGWPV